MHKRWVVVIVVIALAVGLAGLVGWRLLGRKTDYQQAVAWLPKSTLRASYTDWTEVRSRAHGTTLGAASSKGAVQAFLDRAFNEDLSSVSALSDSTYALAHDYGFSPLDARWEMYGQSRQGAVDLLRLDDSVDMEGIERSLRTLGYTPPAGGADSGGTWTGTPDLVAKIDGTLSGVQQNIVVLTGQHLVLSSDSASYASSAADVVRGDDDPLTDVAGVSDLASAAGQPVDAVMWASDFACSDLSDADADGDDQRATTALIAKAGAVNPLSGLVMAQQDDRELVVGMHFESSDEASANLQPRVDLASGPAPGQGGTFSGRFKITKAEADGKNIVMHLHPRRRESLLSDISQGPVLFATC